MGVVSLVIIILGFEEMTILPTIYTKIHALIVAVPFCFTFRNFFVKKSAKLGNGSS